MKNLFQSIPILIAVVFSATGADDVVYAVVGQKVTLTPREPNAARYMFWDCCSPGVRLASLNPLSASWSYAQEERWKDRLLMSNSALTIRDLREEDFGTFTFSKLVEPTTTKPVQTFKLSKITVKTKPPLLAPGESLTLNCEVETPQNHRKPEIYWLSPEGKTHAQGVTVKVTSKDSGNWICVVNKENKAPVLVTVVDLSPALSHSQYTSQSKPLTIPCSIPSHITWEQIKKKGVQEVHWQFFPKLSSGIVSDDPQKLFSLSLDPLQWKPEQPQGLNPVPDLNKGILNLTRSQGKLEDRGDYVCSMKFQNGVTLNRTVHVEVLQITASPETSLTSGEQLSLTCGIGRSLPSDLHVKWVPPKQSVHSSFKSAPQPTNFTIPVNTRDNGTWRCELWQDSTPLTSHMITLKIEPKLSVWMLVIICSAAVIVVLLLILVFILFRHRQRKMRHPRHRLCQCKNPKPKGFYKT